MSWHSQGDIIPYRISVDMQNLVTIFIIFLFAYNQLLLSISNFMRHMSNTIFKTYGFTFTYHLQN